METVKTALELLRRAIKERQVKDHVLDDVEIAADHLGDALREWNNE
jgi:hypothetical protein